MNRYKAMNFFTKWAKWFGCTSKYQDYDEDLVIYAKTIDDPAQQ